MGEVLCNLDDLHVKLENAVAVLLVIHGAIEGRTIPGVGVEADALFCVWDTLSDISNELSKQIDRALEINQRKKGHGVIERLAG